MTLSPDDAAFVRQVVDYVHQMGVRNDGTMDIYPAWVLRLCALAQREPDGGTWRPMETAPKDGSLVMLFRQHGAIRVYGTGFWWHGGVTLAPSWIVTLFGNFTHDSPVRDAIKEPTHWMPLPSPPLTGEPT